MENKLYIKIIKLENVDSTNAYAYQLAKQGVKEITIVKARSQSKGRGRLGRVWYSPKDKGIYVSFVLRPSNSLRDLYYFPLISALAVAKTLKGILPVKIKLPNDVIVGNKKVAGILVEAKVMGKHLDFVILGIGINVSAEKRDLPAKATSIFLETGNKYDMEELFRKLMKEVINLYREFKKGDTKLLFKEALRYQEEKSLKKMQEVLLKDKEKQEVVCLL
jgi:BirA family biotin operon repressor/biotin-[acetyl-CoA-carboxylase] ligase